MNSTLSPNTQAILMLTSPMMVGRGAPCSELLSPPEYRALARYLHENHRQPADLLGDESAEIVRGCRTLVDQERVSRLLGRGLLLSQAMEYWQTRAIWVVSRADPNYPRSIRSRLKETAPPILYGCGNPAILETGGLAVVGSRQVEDTLIAYAARMGSLAATAGQTLVSGGARGIDQAAMSGALEAKGRVAGVLADSLERAALNRDNRNALLAGLLVLVSPYDPKAGFNVGHAMQRNKLVYALANAALVVNSDVNKGGTWTGAIEQLEKLHFVRIFVRSTGESAKGLDALRERGAEPWPNPENADALNALLSTVAAPAQKRSPHRDSSASQGAVEPMQPGLFDPSTAGPAKTVPLPVADPVVIRPPSSHGSMGSNPAQELFSKVRQILLELLIRPQSDTAVSDALQVSIIQAQTWLQRLKNEGVVEQESRQGLFVARQQRSMP